MKMTAMKMSMKNRGRTVLRVGLCVAMIALTVLIGTIMAGAKDVTYSEGLRFISNGDGTCYVSGIGTCTDTDLVIPPVSPDGDRVIGIQGASFMSRAEIISVTIPEGVETIGGSAFHRCQGLKKVVLPEGLTEIGERAFEENDSLESISIPSTVVRIKSYAFNGCTRLSEVIIPADSQLAYIEHRAFGACGSLTSMEIPAKVKSIGTFPFSDCAELASITVAEDNETYHSDGNCLIRTKTQEIVAGCKNSVIPTDGSVKKIGYGAFYGCSDMTAIDIPEGVTTIGYSAFEGCSGLTEITLPDSVTVIDQYAFEDCSSLSSITIPAHVNTIGRFAFSYCTGLKSVVITYGVKSIDHAAFSECASLTDVTIPDSVTEIGSVAFLGCRSLKHIVIPQSVSSIEDGTFSSSGLMSIDIPNSVTTIGSGAFSRCPLREIAIPDSVTSIGSGAFGGCKDLRSFTFPANITVINDYMFQDCQNLSSVTIPNSVTKIGYIAFLNCHRLTTVHYAGTTNEWSRIKINNNYNGNRDLYRAAIRYIGGPSGENRFTGGMWVSDMDLPAQGWVRCDDGHRRVCIDGIPQYTGAIADSEGYIYYINSSAKASVQDRIYYVTKSNGLVPNGYYTMDGQGRLMDGRGDYVMVDTAMEDGLKYFADGTVVYYENGVRKTYAGLIEFEGAYYYINDNAKPVAGKCYYITNTNGLTFPNGEAVEPGYYRFDAYGKMILVENGFVDGLYYENYQSVRGLVYWEGDYYYLSTYQPTPIAGKTYCITNTNGLLPKGWYEFNENGVLILN